MGLTDRQDERIREIVREEIRSALSRLLRVREGEFAREGTVGQEYLPLGTGANLLRFVAAEAEAQPFGPYETVQYNQPFGTTTPRGVVDTDPNGQKRVFVSQNDGAMPVPKDAYSLRPGAETTCIFSCDAFNRNSFAERTVILRAVGYHSVYPASGLPEPVVLAESAPVVLAREDGPQRLFVGCVPTAENPYVRVEHVVLDGAAARDVGFRDFMLEAVAPYRTHPSKFALPGPRDSEFPARLVSPVPADKLALSSTNSARLEANRVSGPNGGYVIARGGDYGGASAGDAHVEAEGRGASGVPPSAVRVKADRITLDGGLVPQFDSGWYSISAGTLVSVAHGLGRRNLLVAGFFLRAGEGSASFSRVMPNVRFNHDINHTDDTYIVTYNGDAASALHRVFAWRIG